MSKIHTYQSILGFLKVIKIFRYEGNLISENSFSEAINEGFKNEDLRNLVIWLANEISEIAKMEEKVKEFSVALSLNFINLVQITQDSDVNSFLMELSGFLKELQCCYEAFSSDGNLSNKLQSVDSRFLLLELLIGELMTQKMLLVCQKPKNKSSVITIVSEKCYL